MSERIHTPGPWTAGQQDMESIIGSRFIYDPGNECVAEADAFVSDDWNVVMANAHLIAAAPDLLAACEMVLANLDYLRGKYLDKGVLQSTCDMVRAAVAKATDGCEPGKQKSDVDTKPPTDDPAVTLAREIDRMRDLLVAAEDKINSLRKQELPAPAGPVWTTELPTVPGWYFVADEHGMLTPTYCDLEYIRGDLKDDYKTCRFAGPIPAPREPEAKE